LRNKLLGILLIFVFSAVILQPLVPFVQYYLVQQSNKMVQIVPDDCDCSCQSDEAKMASNGDAYLKALIKRVCNDQKKQTPKLQVLNISVFVVKLFENIPPVYTCPENNFTKISDFIIQPPLSSYNQKLFRPPQFA